MTDLLTPAELAEMLGMSLYQLMMLLLQPIDGITFSFAPTVKITRKGLGLIARRMSEATLQLEYTKAGA